MPGYAAFSGHSSTRENYGSLRGAWRRSACPGSEYRRKPTRMSPDIGRANSRLDRHRGDATRISETGASGGPSLRLSGFGERTPQKAARPDKYRPGLATP